MQGRYRARSAYSDPNLVDQYDCSRFGNAAGQLLDSMERQLVLKHFPLSDKQVSVLDLGSGTGRFIVDFLQAGGEVTACDISFPMLRKNQQKLSELKLEKGVALVGGDIFNLPFRDCSFDYIACIHVFPQLGNPENQYCALNEVFRVLKTGGIVFFDIANSNSLNFFLPKKKKQALNSIAAMVSFVSNNSTVNIQSIEGRLTISQTALKIAPKFSLSLLRNLDEFLCGLNYKYATRVYFALSKL